MLRKSILVFIIILFVFIPATICISVNSNNAFVIASNSIVKNYEDILQAEKEQEDIKAKERTEETNKTIATRSSNSKENTSKMATNTSKKNATNANTTQYEQSIPSTYKGYNVLGRIEIAKIGLSLNILSVTNDESLKVSATRFYGPATVNQIGNFVITGHNSGNSTLFGRLNNIGIGDTVKITGVDNVSVTYKVYNIFEVYPEEGVKAVKHDMAGSREITLITCTDDGVKRRIFKAREI